MILEFTAAKIAEIAFGGMIEGGAGKLTEIAIEKVNLLRQKIWNKLRGNPDAERAIKAVEQGSKSELVQVTEYLQACMVKEPAFAEEIQIMAKEIQISNTQDNSRTQTFQDNEKVYYAEKVDAQDVQFGDRINPG
ncbi:hypothetical protein NDA03_12570 [Trichocoleus sp. Lan]|uniref:hypothetical protein n=1 Tax=Trichocoleus sp. Lan TaxID=2933927 RepID=UPI003297A6DF